VYPTLVARKRLSKSPPTVARQRRGKKFTAATNTNATPQLLCDPCRIKKKQAIGSSQNFLLFEKILPSAPVLDNIYIYVYTYRKLQIILNI
jgi:hypothetical protein